MPEEEAFSGNRWNRRVNVFLSALGWQQIGDSNVDIACSQCRKNHGLDSVFVYELKGQAPQLVFVEAKERKWKNAYKTEIEKWCAELSEKIEHVPYSPDFVRKFPIPPGASYNTGLIPLWISDVSNFDSDQFSQRLRAVKLPEYRRNPKRIFVLSNQQILFLTAIKEELHRLEDASGDFHDVSFYLPAYGRFSSTVTHTLPLEYIYSKLIFATAKKRYEEKRGDSWHPIDIAFYTGAVDYESLDFLRLALRRFDVGAKKHDLYLYFAHSIDAERSPVAQFQRELKGDISGDLEIKRLTLSATLPGWLSYEN